jgi:rod shape-determining protein MreC
VARNGLRAVAFGGGSSGLLELRYLAANAEIVNGDKLVTSGIDGVYPQGLPVATVTRVERDATNVFARVLCQPAAGVDRGRIVLLITPVEAPATAQPDVVPDRGREKSSAKGKRQRAKDARAP